MEGEVRAILKFQEDVWSSPRPISTAKLNTLPCLHMQPINLVVYKGSYWLTPWDI